MIGCLYTASVRCAAVILMFASCAEAQWIIVRTEGVPRTKDGKLDRTAQAPRTADGKPDFSGLWYPGGERQPCGAKPEDCIEQGLGKSLKAARICCCAGSTSHTEWKADCRITPWVAETHYIGMIPHFTGPISGLFGRFASEV